MIQATERKLTVAIPVRLESKRLPRKALASVAGEPLIRRVVQWVIRSRSVAQVLVLTDSHEIAAAVQDQVDRVFVSGIPYENGTARIAGMLADTVEGAIVNVQGDQLAEPELLDELARVSAASHVVTPIVESSAGFDNRHIVKAAVDENGRALYFSRSPIPWNRNPHSSFLQHVGVYRYSSSAISSYGSMPRALADKEDLEQLRFLESGMAIDTFLYRGRQLAVNSASDLEKARDLIQE